MEAILNSWVPRIIAGREHARRIAFRATERVPAEEIRDGDTIIEYTVTGRVPLYRVVDTAREDIQPGKVVFEFDMGRDVPGPGEDEAAFSHGGRAFRGDALIERVTDLGGHEMCSLHRVRHLDVLSDGRVVWEVARHATSDGEIMVRFAEEDTFRRFRPGTIVLVRNRLDNPAVRGELDRSRRLCECRH